MKKALLLSILVLALFAGSQPAFSQPSPTDNHDVTVAVPSSIDFNLVGGNVTLNTVNSFTNSDATYTLEHNHAGPVSVTAQVTGGAGVLTGITLQTTVAAPASGASAGIKNLITAGVIDVAQTVLTGIAAGNYVAPAQTITYNAGYTFASTLGNQVFTVTYTAIP